MIDYIEDIAAKERSTELLTVAYRRFARTLRNFSDLNLFSKSLDTLLQEDPHLAGSLFLPGGDSAGGAESFEIFEKGRIVLPLRTEVEEGFVRVDGRRDERPFGAEDLQLMGAMAGFISGLYTQARKYSELEKRNQVHQFLIDQLPLGVLCFDSDGNLVSANAAAWRQLDVAADAKSDEKASILEDFRAGVGASEETHVEIGGRLMFVVRRSFDIPAQSGISAYILYDLSEQRQKLDDSLDREYYKAQCADATVVVALFRSRSTPGAGYRFLRDRAEDLELSPELIQPFDAYTCAVIFPKRSVRAVRFVLKTQLHIFSLEDAEVAVLPVAVAGGSPSGETLRRGLEQLSPAKQVFLPQVLVLEAYAPVSDTLEMMFEGVASLTFCPDVAATCAMIRSAVYDGLVLDVDSYGSQAVDRITAEAGAHMGFRLFFSSVKQRHTLKHQFGVRDRDIILHKPFDSAAVVEAVISRFNLP